VPEAAFVMSACQPYSLRELAATLQYELGLQAVASSLHLGRFPDHRPDRVYVLLDPAGYAAIEGEEALPDDAILKRTILLCADDGAPGDGELDLLQRAGAVFALDARTRLAMERAGVPARLLRPGYSKSLDHFDPDATRPIDVMFLGAHSLRRTKYLSRAARVLARHNCLVQISEPGPSHGEPSSLAESRWALLAQTKVVINLHRGEDVGLEWRRTLDAIHAGAVVVAEHSSGIAPLVPGEHLMVAGPDSLPYVAEAMLRDEPRLASLRSLAHERISTWVPYALPVSILRAAVVELVGEPVPPGASLGATRPRPAGTDWIAPPVAAESDPEIAPGGEATDVEVAHESPGWEALGEPRLTVITALAGDRGQVELTLDSVVSSRLREFELVVVDGGSGEETRAGVEGWMDDHPGVAARLVMTSERGLGAARNAGLGSVRAPYCLILDAGQEIYPRCLGALADTLAAMPEVAFIYPMAEVTDAPDAFVNAGGDYLMSFSGWDPARLRLGNHIQVPALIRSDRLRELGGFATDSRLAGFEDYDLWCRMAERGWRGQLVAQELARRPESGSSGALATIRLLPGAAATALAERAPRLLCGALPRA
jgi:hypothetical protein